MPAEVSAGDIVEPSTIGIGYLLDHWAVPVGRLLLQQRAMADVEELIGDDENTGPVDGPWPRSSDGIICAQTPIAVDDTPGRA